MTLAAERRPGKLQVGQIAMLDCLLSSPSGTATIDDATENLDTQFRDGGKWRGSVVQSLAMKGIIKKVGVEVSNRPSRHRGYVSRWRIVDQHKAIELRARLKAAVECHSDTTNDKSKTPSATFGEERADDVSNLKETTDSNTPTNQED